MTEKAQKEVEVIKIDRRYEEFRLKNKTDERILLSSILENGIRDPLQCVNGTTGGFILLDGFKRLRCAISLKIHTVPVLSLGCDEVDGILQLIRLSNARSLNILEQAALVDQLHKIYDMGVNQIAGKVERSPAWVSIRLGMIQEMTPLVRQAIFSGKFPLRSYMYNLRMFTRVNKIPKKEIETFVECVSAKGLSTRDIETLVYGYFHGGDQLKDQIKQGNLQWTIRQLRRSAVCLEENTLNTEEQRAIKDLELVQKYMGRVRITLTNKQLCAESFFETAHLLIDGIMSKIQDFQKCLQDFYAQRR